MQRSKIVALARRVLLSGSVVLTALSTLALNVRAQEARYVVRFKQSHSAPKFNELNKSLAKSSSRRITPQADLDQHVKSLGDLALQEISRIPADNSAVLRLGLEEAKRILARKDVASIDLDSEVYALFDTNDPLYSQQYALNGEFGARISQAWDSTTGASKAIIAVIDTGADLSHSDLIANLWKNPKEKRGNKIDDDANGCIDDIYGCDLVNSDGSPQDDNGHGTHVAGIVAARGNNGTGVAGVAWGSKIVLVKALDKQGAGFISGIARAIDYVTTLKAKGAPIVAINLSLGGGSYSQVLYRAVERARNHDILVVSASGNEGSNNDLKPLYPANLSIDSVVSVAATDQAGALASYSNYGVGSVHIAAPGTQIWSTALQSLGYSYRTASGTSMASPLVAGVISLIAGANPALSMLQVRSILLSTTRQLPGLQGFVITGGLVDAQAAVSLAKATTALPRVAGYVRTGLHGTRGVADATVTIESRDGSQPLRTTKTGGDGSYSFSELALGNYLVRVKKAKLKFSPATVRATSARTVRCNFPTK